MTRNRVDVLCDMLARVLPLLIVAMVLFTAWSWVESAGGPAALVEYLDRWLPGESR